MTVKQIKSEVKERFTVSRYKAMPAYCALFFVIINIAVVTALLCAVTSVLPFYVSAILWWYGCLLFLLVLALCGPFSYSVSDFYIRAYDDKNSDAALGFAGFEKQNFVRTALAFLLRFVFTLLLTCLLIFPGVIFAIKTSMTYQLMRENTKMNVFSAFKESSKLMKGHSALYFKLIMSFFGMFVLCIVSLGAGFIFVMPYFNTCKTIFYNRVLRGDSAEYESAAKDVVSESNVVDAVVENVEVERTDGENIIAVSSVTEEPKAENDSKEDTPVIVLEAVGNSDVNNTKTEKESDNSHEASVVAEPIEITVSDKAENVEKPKNHIEIKPRETSSETKPSAVNAHNEKADASMDDIRRRIEQLRKERDKKSGRPEHAPRPPRPKPKIEEVKPVHSIKRDSEEVKQIPSEKKDIYDGFGPEKIEVEIVEED